MTAEEVERRYTLDEAERLLSLRECHANGHRTQVVLDAVSRPTRLLCTRCDEHWRIIPSSAIRELRAALAGVQRGATVNLASELHALRSLVDALEAAL